MSRSAASSIEWVRDVAPAAWVRARLHPFLQGVGSVVPEGFVAYGRLFHPVEVPQRDGPHRERWSDVARRNDRIVHPEMQFHMITRPRGQPAPEGFQPGVGPSWGSLPLDERRVLLEVLTAHTRTTHQCWFCLWDGFGGLDDRGVSERVELPNRRYLLYRGPVELALTSGVHGMQSPNLWWPEDRAWFVATEIDYAWTYVGGSGELVDALVSDDRLEVLSVRLTDKPFYDSDLLNAALDAG